MKLLLVCVFVVVGIVSGLPAERKTYTTKYDNVDVDRILNNERILSNYIKCLMEEGPCTAEGRELKKTLPDALSTGCTKCNDRQKTTADKIIRHLMSKRAKDWDRLTKKYDPKGEYQKSGTIRFHLKKYHKSFHDIRSRTVRGNVFKNVYDTRSYIHYDKIKDEDFFLKEKGSHNKAAASMKFLLTPRQSS